MKYPNRWQDCKPFVDTLDKHGYVSHVTVSGKEKQGLQLCMADGMYLYMYELWQDGVEYGESVMPRGDNLREHQKALRRIGKRKKKR